MKLISFQVRMFRNIVDSGLVTVDQNTCLVGKNEAGKSALLQALHALNPANPVGTFSVLDDYPRWLKKEHEITGQITKTVPITASFELSPPEVEIAEGFWGKGVFTSNIVQLSRAYGESIKIGAPINYKGFVQFFIAQHADSLLASRLQSGKTSDELRTLLTAISKEVSPDSPTDPTPEAVAAKASLQKLDTLLQGSGSLTEAVRKWVSPLVPTTFYFSNYSQLRGRYLLSEVIAAVASPVEDEQVQAAADFLKLARVSGENLENWDFETCNSELESVSSLLSNRVKKHWKQNQHLKLGVKIEAAQGNVRHLQFRVEDTRHDFTSRLDRRSTGFQWFVSFIAAFFEFETTRKLILLLDEPGLSLHARAQMDLLEAIQTQLAQERQVIYSTHSPFMVRPDGLHFARIVEDRGPELGSVVSNEAGSITDPDTIFPLQAALGYDIGQNLFIGARNALLEGVSDLIYLSVISTFLGRSSRTAINEGIRLLPVGGATNIATFVALLGAKLGIAVVLDGNSQRQRVDNSAREGIIPAKNILSLDGFSNIKGADIEDLFEAAEYLSFFNAATGKSVEIGELVGEDRIVKRLERVLGTTFDHNAVASYFVANQSGLLTSLSESTLERFERLIGALNKALPNPP